MDKSSGELFHIMCLKGNPISEVTVSVTVAVNSIHIDFRSATIYDLLVKDCSRSVIGQIQTKPTFFRLHTGNVANLRSLKMFKSINVADLKLD